MIKSRSVLLTLSVLLQVASTAIAQSPEGPTSEKAAASDVGNAPLAGMMFDAGPDITPDTTTALPAPDQMPVPAARVAHLPGYLGAAPAAKRSGNAPLPLATGADSWQSVVTTFDPSAAQVMPAGYVMPPGMPMPMPGQPMFDPSVVGANHNEGELLEEGYDGFDESGVARSGVPYGDLWKQYHTINERMWATADYLHWRLRGYDVPVLITSSPDPNATPPATAGVLGAPGTSILMGDDRLARGFRDGGRFRFGFWSVDGQFVGYQFEYFGFGREKNNLFLTAAADGAILARPFFNTDPGVNAEDASLLNGTGLTLDFTGIGAFPYDVDGQIDVKSHSDIHSAGFVRKHVLWVDFDQNIRVDYLLGFRYFRLDENLAVTDTVTLTALGGGPLGTGTRVRRVDDVDVLNDLYAGEIGITSEIHRGRFSLNAMGKIALGNMHQVLNMRGETFIAAPGGSFVKTADGGFLVQPSNAGRQSRDSFVIMPEAELSLACQITDNLVANVGLNALFINRILRPGQQLDHNINETRIPPAAAPTGPVTPIRKFEQSYLWAFGINAGLQFRY